MRHLLHLLLLTATGLLPALLLQAQTPVECGVSEQLAKLRTSQVSDVAYTLHFDLPAQKQEAVRGKARMAFVWSGGDEDLQIDFQGTVDGNHITVNGKKRPIQYHDEHVVVSRKWLKKGKHNHVDIDFVSGDKALNRNADYLYTLFVPDHALSVFPCFYQPDLNARLSFILTLPQ